MLFGRWEEAVRNSYSVPSTHAPPVNPSSHIAEVPNGGAEMLDQ